jgi:hypothetical protein
MQLIEQAIFTSAETDRSAGYQVVAAGKGLSRDDLGELAVWGPSHDALLSPAPGAASLNFHALPSGAFCVSLTTAAGREYSGRGARIYTQCLIVPPEVLKRFANNPFAVIRAATAAGAIQVHDEIPSQLEPLQLAGGTATVDLSLLARLAANPGPDWVAALVDAALNSASVALAGVSSADQLIAGLINCLPPECRAEFSFTTGLKFSSRRPFRIVAIGSNPEEQRRVERLYNATVLDFSGEPPAAAATTESWAQFIRRTLRSGRTSLLARQLANCPEQVTLDELPALGLEYLEELDAMLDADDRENLEEAPPQAVARRGKTTASSRRRTQAHRAHRRSAKSIQNAAVEEPRPPGPSTFLEPADRGMLDALRKLDALVYEAITGPAESIEKVRSMWRRLESDLDAQVAARWREQYLRYALSIWSQTTASDGVRYPGQAVRSLDVVCSLLDEPQTPPPA